ncbi:TMEM175 family protein [Microlunatus ginsengisoli]|uniref:TMEM175 family protein n=1 Tax=Microlunatus ginsengisoli TaxID=363863 RepID=A0ABP6ZUZ4_9ACTN
MTTEPAAGATARDAAGAETADGQPGTDRLISFSDGVIAIAITLLVLPLTDIHPAGENVWSLLADNRGALLGFGLTFAVIANYWSAHRTLLTSLRGHTTTLVQLNTIWLATIVFLPFPTSLLDSDLHQGYATLYIVSLLAASLLTVALARYLHRHPELRDRAAPDLESFVATSWAAAGALVVAGAISVAAPRLGLGALLLIIPAQLVAARSVRRRASGPRDRARTT